MAKAATSRKQKSEVRYQNFKVSPAATILKIMNNAGDLDTPGEKSAFKICMDIDERVFARRNVVKRYSLRSYNQSAIESYQLLIKLCPPAAALVRRYSANASYYF